MKAWESDHNYDELEGFPFSGMSYMLMKSGGPTQMTRINLDPRIFAILSLHSFASLRIRTGLNCG